tara:strand:- start:945 stop:2294 length:1350 start_codon:yes stop_codon:yes gene_type:complete
MSEKILNKNQLIESFEKGCKPKDKWKIGTEHEKFGFQKKNLKPINFDQIEKIFYSLNNKFDWKMIFENGHVIALKKAGSNITLEPGGQIELSGAPLENIFLTCEEVNSHQRELKYVSDQYGIDYIGMGFLPKWEIADTPKIPKRRYQIMRKYMQKVGDHGLDMMHRTATIQTNLDYESEEDMVKKFRISISIQPAIIALYANSPFVSGKLSNFMSYRSWVWQNTDHQRCGFLPMVFEKNFSFEKYVDYVLNVPMYFLRRNNHYIDCTGMSFLDFISGKFNSKIYGLPLLSDWEDHMTTVFPEVRLKTFLELRGTDGGPWSSVCALPAFWVGLLYDSKNIDILYDMIEKWTNLDRKLFYSNVAKFGMKAESPNKKNICILIEKLLILSKDGLDRRAIEKNNENESKFLSPLFKILERGNSPAEIWAQLFQTKWNKKIDNIYKNNIFSKTK